MKPNQIYIVSAFVIILVLILWNSKKAEVTNVQDTITSTSTPTTEISDLSTKSANKTQKQTPTPSIVKTPNSNQLQNQEPVPSFPTASDLNGSVFKLTSYNGSDVAQNSKFTISFDDGILNVKFCNSMKGDFVLDGNLIKATNLISTMMYCSEPGNIMEIENAFVSMLNFGAIIYQSGNKIILSQSKGTVMVFMGF